MKTIYSANKPELFIALETTETDPQFLRCFTTEVMRWDENIWIMDISLFVSYWQSRAARSGLRPVSLWRKVLTRFLEEENSDLDAGIISMSSSYIAGCASNPWSAVLLLYAMKAKGIKGLVSLNSRSGQSLYRGLLWDTWWQMVSIIAIHFSKTGSKGFRQAIFRKQCQRFKLAIPRLGFKCPLDMNILNHAGIKRRFGTVSATLWSWAYGGKPEKNETVQQSGFPWRPWKFKAPLVIKRFPDYPLSLWEQFTLPLIEDMDKLCEQIRNSGQRVIRIDWRVTLEDMSELHVPIRFRNPHDPQSEAGDHHTTLLQANYGFIEAAGKWFSSENMTGDSDSLPSVISWKLELSASLIVPDIMLDIFGEAGEKDSDMDILLRLENELPVNLIRYTPQSDWLPEDSYLEGNPGTEAVSPPGPEINRSLVAAAEERPLYIRHSPLPLTIEKEYTPAVFLESTMNKWWKEEHTGVLERNYYKQIDPDGNSVWVFRDSLGHWYQHGIFG